MQNYLDELGLKFYNPNKDVLYKYVDIETAIKILENHSLKFSKPTDFNDPFELTTDFIDFSYTEKELKEFINSKFENKSRREKRFAYKSSLKTKNKLEPVLKNALSLIKENIGISCFSNNYNKPLMWSHYSDKHKGICLGFKIHPAENFFLLHVKYVKELKKRRYWAEKDKIFPVWVFTKSHVWENEEEIRAIYMFQNGIFKFDYECLIEIYFGLRTSKSNKDKICEILNFEKYKHVKKYEMEINPKKYDLRIKVM